MSAKTSKAQVQQQLFETAALYDITALRDEELLFLLLGKSIPARIRAKVQMIIKSLLDDRRGLAGILDIDLVELSMSYELDLAIATQLKALVEVALRLSKPSETLYQIQSPEDAATLLRPAMMHLKHEELHVLVLNTRNQVVRWDKRYRGTVNSAELRVAEILRPAIIRNSPRILIAHNHPSGNPIPSNEDIEVSKQILQAISYFDITLIDHIIIGGSHYISLKDKLPNLAW